MANPLDVPPLREALENIRSDPQRAGSKFGSGPLRCLTKTLQKNRLLRLYWNPNATVLEITCVIAQV